MTQAVRPSELLFQAVICAAVCFGGLAVAEQPAPSDSPAPEPAPRKPFITLPSVPTALPQRLDGYGWMIRLHPTPAATVRDACAQAVKKGVAMPGGQPIVFDLSADGQPQFYGASVSGNPFVSMPNPPKPATPALSQTAVAAGLQLPVIAVPFRPERPAKPDWISHPVFRPGVLFVADSMMPSAPLERIVADWTVWLGDDRIDIAAQSPKGRGVLPYRPIAAETASAGELCAALSNRLTGTLNSKPSADEINALKNDIKTFYAANPKFSRFERTETGNLQSLLDADPAGYHGSGRSFWQNHMAFFYAENKIEPRLSRALCLANAAVYHEPSEPDYLDTFAETYFATGQYDKAIEVIDSALKQTTDHGRPMGGDKRRYLEKQRAKFVNADKATRTNALKE